VTGPVTGPLEVRRLGWADADQVLRLLAHWAPVSAPADPLHLGDVGWHLRFEPEQLDRRLVVWSDVDRPVAVGVLLGDDLGCAFAPEARDHRPTAGAVADSLDAHAVANVDTAPGGALWQVLHERGWSAGDDPFRRFYRVLDGPLDPVATAELVTDATAADRVDVQVNSFERSTFTVPRWQAMTGAPGGAHCVDMIIRDRDGRAAAAATGWFAGPGRCALLEPVGTHRAYRRRGYGTGVVEAVCAELAARGASGVAVSTPERNEAGGALYRRAGFAVVGRFTTLRRPAA
jgi:ribosomal protein S18 acetylase RimI-like enzyme